MTQCMLLAVDGSQGGDRALEYSIAQAKDRGITLIVAYVIEWSPYTFNTPRKMPSGISAGKVKFRVPKRRLLIRQ